MTIKPNDALISPLSRPLKTLLASIRAGASGKFITALRRLGQTVDHKRVWRVYRQMGLNLLRRSRKRLPARLRQSLTVPTAAYQRGRPCGTFHREVLNAYLFANSAQVGEVVDR